MVIEMKHHWNEGYCTLIVLAKKSNANFEMDEL